MQEEDKVFSTDEQKTKDKPLKLSVSDQALLDDIDRVTDWEKVRRDLDEIYGPDWGKD